jgi:rRNA maturation endonuclease Nob1
MEKNMKQLDDFKEIFKFLNLRFKCEKCHFEYEDRDFCPRCGHKYKQEKEIFQYV